MARAAIEKNTGERSNSAQSPSALAYTVGESDPIELISQPMNETYDNWIRVVHIIGFLMWTGGLISTLSLLIGVQSIAGDAHGGLSKIARKTALLMDIGALLTLVGGLYLAFGRAGDNAFKQGGWLHAKSTLVVGLIAIQVFTRIKVRKFRNGNIKPIPRFVIPLTLVLIAVIVIFGVVKPLS